MGLLNQAQQADSSELIWNFGYLKSQEILTIGRNSIFEVIGNEFLYKSVHISQNQHQFQASPPKLTKDQTLLQHVFIKHCSDFVGCSIGSRQPIKLSRKKQSWTQQKSSQPLHDTGQHRLRVPLQIQRRGVLPVHLRQLPHPMVCNQGGCQWNRGHQQLGRLCQLSDISLSSWRSDQAFLHCHFRWNLRLSIQIPGKWKKWKEKYGDH